jgi:hypothetical protein
MKFYVATGADDDSIDIDTGAQANIQFALLIQRAGRGDALMEMDSNSNGSDTPRTTIRIANFVGLQSLSSPDNEGATGATASTFFRGNSDTTLINGVISAPNNECIRMDGRAATPATLTVRSVVLNCNATKFVGGTGYTAAQVAAIFGSGANNNNDAFTTSFSSLFINGTNESAVVATDPATFSGFPASVQSLFTATNYIGAVKDINDTRFSGWTCNSTTANFGTTSATGVCSSLPTN